MRVTTHFALWLLGLAEAETQTSDKERTCLSRFAGGRKRLVEIGTWHGVSSSCLKRAMAPDGVLICVDPYPIGRFGFSIQRLIALKEVSKVRNGTVRWIRMTGADAGRQFAGSGESAVDFIFIDGDHSYDGLRQDWEIWSGLLADGGFIALHDSRSSAARKIDDAGSVIYTREVILPDPRFRLIECVDTLSVLERKAL
jgi:predicted O-methyltransferase YrrM